MSANVQVPLQKLLCLLTLFREVETLISNGDNISQEKLHKRILVRTALHMCAATITTKYEASGVLPDACVHSPHAIAQPTKIGNHPSKVSVSVPSIIPDMPIKGGFHQHWSNRQFTELQLFLTAS